MQDASKMAGYSNDLLKSPFDRKKIKALTLFGLGDDAGENFLYAQALWWRYSLRAFVVKIAAV